MNKSPEALAARQACDAIIAANVAGKVDQATVNWVFDKAYVVFRRESYINALREIANEERLV